MTEPYAKTLIFLNLRFADFYSTQLFSELKAKENVKLVAILDQQFKDRVGMHIAPYLDKTYFLESKPKDGFLAEFDLAALRVIVAKELLSAHELRIICTDELNLLNAGRLRREFGLQGYTDQDLEVFRDKVKMKAALMQKGIRVPKHKLFNATDKFPQLVKIIGLPFVIKPIDSCGSHGVEIIRNQEDYNHFQLKKLSKNITLEVEEYIEGKLYHVDSYSKDGLIKFICANEYTYPNHDYIKGKVLGSIPLDYTDPTATKLINFATKCLHALGNKNLINHMELFINGNQEIIFLETSARPPGGFINLTHRVNYAINLMDEDFNLQSGMEVSCQVVSSPKKAFWALFPLSPGKVVTLNQPNVESECEINWYIDIGDVIAEGDCGNVVAKAAHAIFYHADKKTLKKDFEVVKKHQALEVAL